MNRRPNILFLMSDQHNARSMSVAGHPNVKTPTMDRIAARGTHFTRAYCNNPICAPSRVSFVTGQYCHTHGILGNDNFELDDLNRNTLGAVLRRHGYQTAQIGKAHMIKKWDAEAYEHIRYCDLCDADRADPRTNHYFQHLIDHGIADRYEDGGLPADHECARTSSAVADLPYEHSIEHWTGAETLEFLEHRDASRPFFVHMSFERPHPNWMPSADHAGLYDPEQIVLGPDAADWWENRWAGRPEIIMRGARNWMGKFDLPMLKKAIAHHLALVTVIDMEMGRVLDWLEARGELDNTIVVYTADHGEFAGDHGICDKNLGIYESIHRIPFLLSYPGGPRGARSDGIIESIDLFPTLCELAGVPTPETVEGRSIVPLAEGKADGKDHAICEWDFLEPQRRVNAIRTRRHRLVYYSHDIGGELYDHDRDPYEMRNVWDDPEYRSTRLELLEKLFDEVNRYRRKTDFDDDHRKAALTGPAPTSRVHGGRTKWSQIEHLFQD